MARTFCSEYLATAEAVGDLAWWFIAAALAVGVSAALIGLLQAARALRKPLPKGGAESKAEAVPLDTFVTAIKGLIEALSAAPAWLALFGGGLFLFYLAGTTTPSTCDVNKPLGSNSATTQPAPPVPGGAGAGGNRQGG